jgi:hypothetical protein
MTTSFRVKSFLACFFAITFLLLGAQRVAAQTASARVEGIVTDNSGAVLPGVTVTATNVGTNASRSDISDSRGAYTIAALPVGDYRVQAELSGFKTEVTPITLTVNQVARMDFKLQLGGVTEVVTVTAAAPLIEKSTSEISTLIDQKQIENLPLNGRNFTQLATLVPGVTRGVPGGNAAGGGSGTNAETFRYAEFGGAGLSVNGLREQFNNYLIEGVDNNETLVNTIAYLPPPEAIREFQVITTNAPAEFGRAGGAIQNLVIKSGVNDFHGTLYEFNRPRSLQAKPEFAQDKPEFKNNDFGVTFGGPIFKDRTFFFGSYHGLRNSIPVEPGNYVTVPTAKMRSGDFSELLDPKVSGLSQPVIIYNPSTGQPFAGNIIPTNLINPIGQKYLNVFPLPTRSGVVRNYLTHRLKKSTYNDYDLRLDQQVAASDQLFLSASDWKDQFSDPGRIPGFQAGFGAGTTRTSGDIVRLGETHVFSGNLLNEIRAGWIDFNFGFLPIGLGTDQNKALGIGGPTAVTVPKGLALVGGGNGTYIEYLGDGGPYRVFDKTLQLSDAVTWLQGSHSFKFGGTAMRRKQVQENIVWEKGFYSFRGGDNEFGFQPGFTGYEVSDMLIGTTSFTATGVPGTKPPTAISWENSLFAQDDWHVNPRLTLNLGLRWDVFTPYYEKDNRLANYDPSGPRLVLPEQNGVSRSTRKTNWDDFGPRLGFAYLLNERTSLRGAYGIFYSLDRGGIANQLTQNPPAALSAFRFGCPAGCIHLSDPIALPQPVNPNNPKELACCSQIIYVPRDSKDTRVQQWSVSAQREILSNTSAMVAYVGTRGDHLATVINAFPLNAVLYMGESSYDSLQVTVRQRESHGLSYLASYTLGNARNNTAGFFPGNPSGFSASATDTSCLASGAKSCNFSIDEGPADYDARHRFTFAATYALPFARENAVVGGWSVNTVVTLQSGTPFTVFADGKRADQNGDPNDGPKKVNKWFDTSVFTKAKGAQGTEARNSVRGPGIHTVDLSLFKNFKLSRYGALELRVEGFNVFNWAQYSQPNQYLGDPNFGKITGTRLNSERQVQLGARFIF